jgi:hypothetical protein
MQRRTKTARRRAKWRLAGGVELRVWKDFYGGAEDIVGRQITISDTPLTVVGVTPPDFHGVWPGEEVRMYMPLQFVAVLEKKDVLEATDNLYGVAVIGRLKPGISLKHANAEVAQLQQRLFAQFIPDRFRHDPFFEILVSSARSGLPSYVTHTYEKPLYLMQGLVAVVLLVCCVNIGGLMMSRVAARQQEFAVRTALGEIRAESAK